MTWTEMTDLAPPKDQEVLLLWDDGIQRIGENFGTTDSPMFKCALDFGDAYASVYAPADYQPVAWTWLPPTMARLEKTEAAKAC